MAQNYSPKIVQDGLILCLDSSQNKSYPTTDLPVKDGLLVWLDAADDSTFSYSSGTSISQWRDKSGNNFHANQSLASAQPSRSTFNNSRKSVNFISSGVDYLLISANSNLALPDDVSIFIVYKPATQTTQYAVLLDNYHGQGGAYGFVIQRVSTNNQFYYANGNGSTFVDASASPWTYTDNVIQLLSLNKLSSTATPYTSGTAQTSRTVHATTAQYTTGLVIGGWGLGGREYNGDMCEILIFNRSLSSREMKLVHTYLGQKWGVGNTDRSIIDLSGNNNHGLLGNGTVANMPEYDYYNKGTLSFSQTLNDTVLTPLPITATPALSNFTYEVWTKLNRYPPIVSPPNGYGVTYRSGFLFGASYYAGAGLLWYGNTNGDAFNLYGFIRGNDAYRNTSAYSFNTNQYYHCVMVNNYGANKLQLYINGTLYSEVATATQEYASSNTPTAGNIGISKAQVDGGGTANYSYYDGTVPVARIYNKALSAAEVLQNYEAQKLKFTNTIVQQGLVLNLDAGNPYSYAGSGTTWFDVSGNNYSGSLISGSSFNSDGGGCIVFDGVDDYVQTNLNQNTDNASITWESWFWDNSAGGFIGNTAIISNYGPNATTPFTLVHIDVNGYPFFGQRNSSGTEESIYYSTNICNSVWHQIVGVVDGSNMHLYIDGVLRGSKTKITGTTTSGQNIVIGSNHLGRYQSCRIASARLYNIALSATQVSQNYNAVKDRYGL